MTTIAERLAYQQYLGKLRAGTPEYNRSELASQWVQKVQQLRDIQAERRDITEKLKKHKSNTLSNVSRILREKKVAPRALHLISQFLTVRVLPISKAHIERAQKIECTKQAKVRHIVQGWDVSAPHLPQVDAIYHQLVVASENTLADLSSAKPTMRLPGGTLAPKTYTEYIHRKIACMKIQELKALCRMRYLKVSGKKSVLVERLMAEKW